MEEAYYTVFGFLKLRNWIINKVEQDQLYIIRSPTKPGFMQICSFSVFFQKTENSRAWAFGPPVNYEKS